MLAQLKKLTKGLALSLQIGIKTPSKYLLFLSFQITQKIQVGVMNHDLDFSDRFSNFHRAPTSVGISDIKGAWTSLYQKVLDLIRFHFLEIIT